MNLASLCPSVLLFSFISLYYRFPLPLSSSATPLYIMMPPPSALLPPLPTPPPHNSSLFLLISSPALLCHHSPWSWRGEMKSACILWRLSGAAGGKTAVLWFYLWICTFLTLCASHTGCGGGTRSSLT